jgi:DNA-binding transcriptional regulator YiaG
MSARKEPPMHIARTCRCCGHAKHVINGAWLRWFRESAGLGLRAMARRVGLSAAYLSDVERGRRNVSPRVENAYLSPSARGPRDASRRT